MAALGRALHAVGEALAEAEAANAATIASPIVVPGDTGNVFRNQGYTDKVGKIAQDVGKRLGRRVTPKQIKDAIHGVKENLYRGGKIQNPDVMVDPTSGDVRPKIPGGMGDTIGNIYDHL